MRWPWQKREQREAGGDYTSQIVQFVENNALSTAANAGSSAAVECAAGALARAFGSAKIDGPTWVKETVTRRVLSQVGRDLVRRGESLHKIILTHDGKVKLIPAADWWWHGGSADPDTWHVRATSYGPSSSQTSYLPNASVVFATWGSHAGSTYRGRAPTTWASGSARLQAESEKALADESAGPIGNLIPVPASAAAAGEDTDGDPERDPLALLRADIAKSRGKAFLLETTADGMGDGRASSPGRDWVAARLGPAPTQAQVDLAQQSFERMLSACGVPPSLFSNADSQGQREALRRWHLGTVLPLAAMLQDELTEKLAAPVKLTFDRYPMDQVSRSQVFAKVATAEGISVQQALQIAGLIDDAVD